MIDNYFKCLPMLEKQEWQYHRDRNPDFNSVSVWECPQNYLLPFQIKRQQAPESVWEFLLFDENDNEVLDLSINIDEKDLKMRTINGADYIFFRAEFPVNNLPCGIHYYYLSDGVREWFSDLFTIIENVEFAEPFITTKTIIKIVGSSPRLIAIQDPSFMVYSGRLNTNIGISRITDINTNFSQVNILG